jgi:hypothetical protein
MAPGTALAWSSVTTGNLAGIDLWLDAAQRGTLALDTNVVAGAVDLAGLADDTAAFDAVVFIGGSASTGCRRQIGAGVSLSITP